jgi:hypothetical protein
MQLMLGLSTITCTAKFIEGDVIAVSPLTSYNPIQFTLDGLFKYYPYTRVGEHFNLLCDGLQNPKTTEPTSSFSLAFYDRYGCGMERVNTGVILYMFGLPSFQSVEIFSNTPYSGGTPATFEVKIVATIIMASGYSFYITFPLDIAVPPNPVCGPGILMSSVQCWALPENELKVIFTFSSPPVPATTLFSF